MGDRGVPDDKRVLETKIRGRVLPHDAKDPGGHLCAEARYHDCDEIQVTDERGKPIATFPTPLCPWTRKVLAQRLERLSEAIGARDPLVAQGCYLASNLILHGTLIPPGGNVDRDSVHLIGNRGTLDQFRVLTEVDLGRSEATPDARPSAGAEGSEDDETPAAG